MFFTTPASKDLIDANVDQYGDSLARNISVNELRENLESMPSKFKSNIDLEELRTQLDAKHQDLGELPGWMFWRMLLYIDPLAEHSWSPRQDQDTLLRMKLASNMARFAGARMTSELNDQDITHIVVGYDRVRWRELRREICS